MRVNRFRKAGVDANADAKARGKLFFAHQAPPNGKKLFGQFRNSFFQFPLKKLFQHHHAETQ